MNMVKKQSNREKKTDYPVEIFNSEAAVLITTADLGVVRANKSLAQMLEVFPREVDKNLLGKIKYFGKENNPVKFEELPFRKASAEAGSVTDFKVRCEIGPGLEKWFRIDSYVLEKSDEGYNTIISIFKDITRDTSIEQIFLEAINSINIILYSTNVDGLHYNFVTEAVRMTYGYSPEEVYSNKMRILRSIYPTDYHLFKIFIRKVQSGEEALAEYRIKDRFGKEHWLRHSGIPILKSGIVVRIVGIIQDITDEKKIQIHMERSEEKFRILVEAADDLIFVLDGFGYFSMVNRNGANALGYTPEYLTGKHFLEFIRKEDESKIAEAFNRILNSTGVTTFEAVFVDRFEKYITFEIKAKPLINDSEVIGMLSVGRNISDRKLDEQKIKELNAKLIEANRIISIEKERVRYKITVLEELNKLKSEFISNVSHELRTPLASIIGFAETIISDSDLTRETLLEFSGIILNEGRRLARLINDLLDFSKLESGQAELEKTEFNIIALIKEVLQTFSTDIKDKALTVTKEWPENGISIMADQERIRKAIYNLISNAIKYNNQSGRISIIIQDFRKEVEIAVSDTGVGIPEKELPNLFQKFSKVQTSIAQVGGTGFGLVTVKQIVDLHKGIIKVRSEEEKGTTVIMRLPK
jgi:PAS domain S-box-containing protein